VKLGVPGGFLENPKVKIPPPPALDRVAKVIRCDFEDIPTGTYALAVIHDENMNGKLDTNLLGVPKEGYGFSNDVKAVRGAPTFSDASFRYDGQNLNFTLSLHY
jgi:uncharacterized protein (DUF2141 family)